MIVRCKPEHLFWEMVPGGLALYPFASPIWFGDEDWLRDEAALDRIDELDRPEVYLDLGGVEHLSSAGVGALLHIGHRAHRRGGRLVTCNTPVMVREIASIIRLDSIPWLALLAEEVPGKKMRLLDPAWLAWEGGIVPSLARNIADRQQFALMPVLADALEDAGCTTADLLDHLRGPGPHVRGCFALQLLLGGPS